MKGNRGWRDCGRWKYSIMKEEGGRGQAGAGLRRLAHAGRLCSLKSVLSFRPWSLVLIERAGGILCSALANGVAH